MFETLYTSVFNAAMDPDGADFILQILFWRFDY